MPTTPNSPSRSDPPWERSARSVGVLLLDVELTRYRAYRSVVQYKSIAAILRRFSRTAFSGLLLNAVWVVECAVAGYYNRHVPMLAERVVAVDSYLRCELGTDDGGTGRIV